MVTDSRSRLRQAAKLTVALLVVGPALVRWGFVEMELAPALDLLREVDAGLLVRVAGLCLVLLVVGSLVRQKRRTRGQRTGESGPVWAADRTDEGSGEASASDAYHDRQKARREGDRFRERAEEVVETDRGARERR